MTNPLSPAVLRQVIALAGEPYHPESGEYFKAKCAALAQAHLETLAEIQAFVAKWDAAKPHIDSACQMSQLHGVPYSGPALGEEVARLRERGKA